MADPIDFASIELRIVAARAEARRTGMPVITAVQTGRMTSHQPVEWHLSPAGKIIRLRRDADGTAHPAD